MKKNDLTKKIYEVAYDDLSDYGKGIRDYLDYFQGEDISVNDITIPPGPPILVGHHSEKSHRGLLNRSDNKMRKGVEAEKKADYYKNKAESAINNNSIFSDDPEAIKKLKEKIQGIEKNREFMKLVNKEYKKHVLKRTFRGFVQITPI